MKLNSISCYKTMCEISKKIITTGTRRKIMCEFAAEEELKLKEKSDHQKYYSKKAVNRFLEEVFEIAFGCDAIYKGYSMEEVVEKLRDFSDQALLYTEENY